jgi:hypothetical protein
MQSKGKNLGEAAKSLGGSCSHDNAPPETEQFYLRMLLNHVRGPKSFNDLKMHNGTEYPTFKESALARGLQHNDAENDARIQEATLSAMPNQIR